MIPQPRKDYAKEFGATTGATTPTNTTEESSVKEEQSGPLNILGVDWLITSSSGKQSILKSDGTEEDIYELLMADSQCYDTNEVRISSFFYFLSLNKHGKELFSLLVIMVSFG